jgi:hypothetical protein
MGIKSYIFKKFFLPKNIIINRPGVILTKTVQKYWESHSQSRIAYVFEDVIADLQLETKKDLGEKETAELWYRIGKDSISS